MTKRQTFLVGIVIVSGIVNATLITLALIPEPVVQEEYFEPLIFDRSNYSQWQMLVVRDKQFLVEGDWGSIGSDDTDELLQKFPRLNRSKMLVLRVRDGIILTVDVYEEKMQYNSADKERYLQGFD